MPNSLCLRTISYLAVLSLLMVPAQAAAHAPPTSAIVQTSRSGGIIQGRIISAGSGRPIEGAVVTVAGTEISARSNPDGRFRLADVPVGARTITVRALRFSPVSQQVEITEGGAVAVELVMTELVTSLATTVVTGTRSEQETGNIPAAITVISPRDIQTARQTTSVDESLRRVPGVAMRVHLAGSTRATVSIRGAGAQSSFGARGVRILVDGIPKNNAGGSGQDFINVDLGSVQRVEVVRGPSSALYGNQAGGVINFITEDGRTAPRLELRQLVGSFGLTKTHVKTGGQQGPFSYFLSAFRTDQRGYRDRSNFFNTGLNAKLGYAVDENTEITTLLAYDNLTQRIPGSLTAAEVAANPRQPNPAIAATGGTFGNIDEFRTAATLRKRVRGQDQIEVTGFYVPRPIYNTTSGGIRNTQFFINRGANVRYLLGAPILGRANRLTVGVDYQNTPLSNGIYGRTSGAQLQQLRENLSTAGVYVQNELNITSTVLLNVGGRYDNVRFGFNDLIRPTANFTQTFSRFTPKVGLLVRPTPWASLYTNYSEGFEAPVSEQLRNSPTAEFRLNRDLRPMLVRSYELGTKLAAPTRRLALDLAVFRQSIDDFTVTRGFRRPDSTTFAASLNAAKVDQMGLELGANVGLPAALELSLAYTYSDFVFDRFVAAGDDFTGNRLAGVPKSDIYAELAFRPASGFYTALEVKSVGRIVLNDANTAFNPSYTVSNVRIGHEGLQFGATRFSPFVSVNNIFSERYSSLTETNNATARFFNPMPGVNFAAGLGMRY